MSFESDDHAVACWMENIKLLAIWFAVSFGCGILLADALNAIEVRGFKLGFWFAQQGPIHVFVGFIFFYVWRMNRIDRKYGVHED